MVPSYLPPTSKLDSIRDSTRSLDLIRTEMRSIENNAHENPSKSARNRSGQDLSKEQNSDSLEVNGYDGSIAEPQTNSRTRDAHGGRY